MFSFYFTKAEGEGHTVSDLNVMVIFPMGMKKLLHYKALLIKQHSLTNNHFSSFSQQCFCTIAS